MVSRESNVVITIISYYPVECITIREEVCTISVIYYRVVCMFNLRISTKLIFTTTCINVIVNTS